MNQALIGGDRVRAAYLGTTRGGHFCHGKHSCDVCWCLHVTPAAPRAAPRPPTSPPSRHWAPPRRPRRPPPPPPPEGVRAVPRKRWRAGSGAARGPAAAGWRCRYRGTRGPARPGPGSALAAAAGGGGCRARGFPPPRLRLGGRLRGEPGLGPGCWREVGSGGCRL